MRADKVSPWYGQLPHALPTTTIAKDDEEVVIFILGMEILILRVE